MGCLTRKVAEPGFSPGDRADGAVAQLGEHLLCKQGVSGSIPLSSTKSIGVETDGKCLLKKKKFASTSVGCLFCIYREEKIDLEASRCWVFDPTSEPSS